MLLILDEVQRKLSPVVPVVGQTAQPLSAEEKKEER